MASFQNAKYLHSGQEAIIELTLSPPLSGYLWSADHIAGLSAIKAAFQASPSFW